MRSMVCYRTVRYKDSFPTLVGELAFPLGSCFCRLLAKEDLEVVALCKPYRYNARELAF